MRLTKKQRDDKIKAFKKYSLMKVKGKESITCLKDTATPSKRDFYDYMVGYKKFRSYEALFEK